MIDKFIDKRKSRNFLFLAITLYMGYDFSVLFKNLIGNNLNILLGFFAFFSYLLISTIYLHLDMLESLIILFPLCINTSYTNILGLDYSSFPLTWFFLVCLLLVFAAVVKRRFWAAGLLTFFMLTIFFLVMLIIRANSDVKNSVNQYINIALYILVVSISPSLQTVWNKQIAELVTKTYVYAVSSYSLMILIQFTLYNTFSIKVGNIMSVFMRTSYGATMGDYSFSTLYIASGIIILFVLMFYKIKIFIKTQTIIFLILFFSALLTVNARTGLFALVFAVGLFMAVMIIRRKRYSFLVVGCLLIPIFMYAFKVMAKSRMNQSLLDGSNRFEGYMNGIEVFKSHFIIGLGFGTQNFKNITGQAIPHNLIIQFLAQFGLIGFGILAIVFISLMHRIISNKNNSFKWAFLTIIIGSMFIPDIISSHFLSVVTVCALCNSMKDECDLKEIIDE